MSAFVFGDQINTGNSCPGTICKINRLLVRCVKKYLGTDVIQKGMLKIYLNVLRNENTVWRFCRAGSNQPFCKILLFWLPLITKTNTQRAQYWPNNTDIRIRKKERTYLMQETRKSRHTIQLDTLHKWVHMRLV